MDLGDSLLSRDLVEDLTEWESRYHASAPAAPGTGAASENRQYVAEGRRLADRLAAELGRSFTVSFEPGSDGHFLSQSGASAANPAAERVFLQWLEEEQLEIDKLGKGRFVAYAPLSGETFGQGSPNAVQDPE